MERWIAITIGLMATTSTHASIIPPDLPFGSEYQLIFVTAGKRDATSRSISTYNSFVAAEAALNPELPDTTWHAVASTTSGTNAKDNAPSLGLPIYNSQGILVASTETGLYTPALMSPILYDQFGVAFDPAPESRSNVWTGTNWRGEGGNSQLGGTKATVGSAKSEPIGSSWAAEARALATDLKPLYALSSAITHHPSFPKTPPEIPGDFDDSGILDVEDLDHLSYQVRFEIQNPRFDVTLDNKVDDFDRLSWVTVLANTYFGDSNLNGEFNSGDLVAIFKAGEYEDAEIKNSTWATGDWNGDADFTSSDLILAFQGGGYERGPKANVQSVPEPSSSFLVLSIGFLFLVRYSLWCDPSNEQ